MDDLRHLIKSRYKNSPVLALSEKAMILDEFKKILADFFNARQLNQISRIFIRDQVAILSTGHPILTQEINLRKKQIIEQLNKKFDKIVINDIRSGR